MAYEHWHYFLALEHDFEATTRYVEPCAQNYSAYSIEFAKILLGVCSEIDVVAKVLCDRVRPNAGPRNINDYRLILVAQYPNFCQFTALVPRYSLQFIPWAAWSGVTNPPWWQDYNAVKHERHLQFQRANLENCISALAGLFGLVLYVYQPELFALQLEPWARVLSIPKQPDGIVTGGYELPDFPNPHA